MFMKRIITFAALALSLIALGACGEDTFEEKTNSVQVVSGKTEIGASGGENKFVLTVDNFTAKPDDDWLKAAISGNELTLSAEMNISKVSRHTYVTVTAENGDFITIPVTQLGMVYITDIPEDVLSDDNANTYEYRVNTNLPLEISSPSWIRAAWNDGVLSVTLDKNPTGAMRTGTLKFEVPAISASDSISFTQAEFSRDFAGKQFLFAGDNADYLKGTSDRKTVALLTEVDYNGSSYSLKFPDYGWSLPIKVNSSTWSFTLPNGTKLGMYESSHVFPVLNDFSANKNTFVKSYTMGVKVEYDPEIGFYAYAFNNNTWKNQNVNGYIFGKFKSTSFTTSNLTGYVFWLVNPFMVEYSMDNDEETVVNMAMSKRFGD